MVSKVVAKASAKAVKKVESSSDDDSSEEEKPVKKVVPAKKVQVIHFL